MQATQLLCLLGSLLLAVAAGWRASWTEIAIQSIPFALLVIAWLPAVRQRLPESVQNHLFAFIFLLFLALSKTGHPSSPLLGAPGFVALHGLLLGCYAVFLARAFFLFSRDRRLEEDLEVLDLWLANIGLMSFAAVFIVRFLANSSLPLWSAVAQALAPAMIPLTACVAWMMVVKCQRAPGDRRMLSMALFFAPLLVFALGATRGVQTYRHICLADQLTAEASEIKAAEILEIARRENQTLHWPAFKRTIEKMDRRLSMRNADPLEQLQALGDHILEKTRDAVQGTDVAEMMKTYMRPDSLEGLFVQLGKKIDRESWAALHETLRALPEEERLLQLMCRSQSDWQLLERYHWTALPEMQLDKGWGSWIAADEGDAYLKGLVLYKQGRTERAKTFFQQALRSEPNHHNTIIWLERIARKTGDPRAVARFRKIEKKIALSRFSGNLVQGVLRGPAWIALELHPGLWEIQLTLRAEIQQRPWPELHIYLDDEPLPIYRGPVTGSDWNTIRLEIEADSETHKRLLIEPGSGSSELILREVRMLAQD